MGLLFAASNRIRSLVPWSMVNDIYQPRSQLYFSDDHEDFAAENIAAAREINRSGCNRIALDSYTTTAAITRSPSSFFVYPLLALIHADGEKRRVWYSGVYNATSRYRENIQHDAPCMVICLECSGVAEKWKDYSVSGGNISKHGGIVIFPVPVNPQ